MAAIVSALLFVTLLICLQKFIKSVQMCLIVSGALFIEFFL